VHGRLWARQNSTLRRYAVLAAAFPDVGIGLVGVALAFSLTVLTMAHAIGRTPVPTSTRPCQLSQRHGLNPSVLRFARFGEPSQSKSCVIARPVSLRREDKDVPILGTFNPQVGHLEQRHRGIRA